MSTEILHSRCIWQHPAWPQLTFDAAALAPALATAAIEGEQLNLESLRSSVAHRLNLADAPGADSSVEGLVQVMQDTLANHGAALDLDRLCRWQSALFPGGTSGITRIAVGRK